MPRRAPPQPTPSFWRIQQQVESAGEFVMTFPTVRQAIAFRANWYYIRSGWLRKHPDDAPRLTWIKIILETDGRTLRFIHEDNTETERLVIEALDAAERQPTVPAVSAMPTPAQERKEGYSALLDMYGPKPYDPRDPSAPLDPEAE